MIASLAQDFRLALRRLGQRPGYAALVTAILALGIGGVIAVYGLLHAALIAALPFHDEARVMRLAEKNEAHGLAEFSVSTANFLSWQAQSDAFEAMAAFKQGGLYVQERDGAEYVQAMWITPGFWRTAGIAPLLGRALTDATDDLAAGVLIGEDLWARRYARDPGVIGRTLRLEDGERRIAGVVASDIGTGMRLDVWLPLDTAGDAANRGDRRLTVLARLKDGATLASARAEMDAIGVRLAREFADDNRGWGVRVEPVREWLVNAAQRERMWWLLGAVGLLLLASCANTASLQIARASQRWREFGIRQAMGADRRRLVRAMLAETSLLALGGSVLGLCLAAMALRLAGQTLAVAWPRQAALSIDPAVAAVAILASVATALLFGLAPAWLSSRVAPAAALSAARGEAGSRAAPLRNVLVATQCALATLLLAGAFLFGQRLIELAQADLGFAPESVLTARIAIPELTERSELERQQLALDRLVREVAALPGVSAAAVASDAPLGEVDTQMEVGPGPVPLEVSPPERQVQASWRIVSSDYFATLGIPLLRGRAFAEGDEPEDSVILARAVAQRVFGADVDPVGRMVTLGNQQRRRVVGVAGDTRQRGVADAMTPTMYFPTSWYLWNEMTLTVRAQGDAAALAATVRERAAQVLPERPLYDIGVLSERVSASTAAPRLQAVVVGAFAFAALVMAAAGIGSVMAWLVVRRTPEFALRIALGATSAQVRGMALRTGLRLALTGIGTGTLLALPLLPALHASLHAGTNAGLFACAAAVLVLLSVCLAACWLPAHRAARVEPLAALRGE